MYLIETTNCNIKTSKCDIYCGRGKGAKWFPANCNPSEYGWLGNPVAIGKICPICKSIHNDGGSTLPCYEKYLVDRLKNDPAFKEEFYKIKGKKLGCFCKPNPCHTDIMIKYLDQEE